MEKSSYKHFDLKTAKLIPRNILGWRESEYNEDLFFGNEIYEEIKYSILKNSITIIVGNPLSGKTRIVYDTLKNDNTSNLIIPQKDKNIDEYILPTTLNNLIVLLDDVDDYCYDTNPALNKLLKYIVTNNVKCILTCRQGPEFYKFKKYINSNIFYKIIENRFHIPRFHKNDELVKSFLNKNIDKFKTNIKNFDGNFGSIVLPLDAMRERFNKLIADEKDTEVAILLGLKLHFHFLNYESSKSEYNDTNIKHFSEKYLNRELSMYDWEEAKNSLLSNDTSLNFIETPSNIFIEEAYLDFLFDNNGNKIDVIHPDFNYKRLNSILGKIYSIDDKKVWGFPTTIYDYNIAIEKTENIEDAINIYNNLPQGITPDSYTFSYIFNKTTDLVLLKFFYKEMISKNKFDIKAAEVFARQILSFNDLMDSLNELDKKILLSLNGVSERLIKLSKISPKDSLKFLFNKFSSKDIFKNPVYNEVCRVCCNDLEDYKNYIEPFINTLESIDKPLQLNFIKTCSKLIKKDSLEIIEKFIERNSFGYLNESGNALSETEPLRALEFFSRANDIAPRKIEKVIALNNYCNLVYEKGLTQQLYTALDFSALKISPDENIAPAKYLKEVYILLNIMKSPINTLISELDLLINKKSVTIKKLNSVLKRIKDNDKKELIIKHYFKVVKNELPPTGTL